jgi:hypothetical protein
MNASLKPRYPSILDFPITQQTYPGNEVVWTHFFQSWQIIGKGNKLPITNAKFIPGA